MTSRIFGWPEAAGKKKQLPFHEEKKKILNLSQIKSIMLTATLRGKKSLTQENINLHSIDYFQLRKLAQ